MKVALNGFKQILRMADGEGAGGAAAAAPSGAAPAAPAGSDGAAAAAKPAAAAAAEPAKIDAAALAANDAAAAAEAKKNPDGGDAAGDKPGEEGKEADKGDDADKAKDGEGEEGETNWEAEPAELYKDLKYPEGVEVAPEMIQPFLDEFKAEKVSPELAQKIVDWHLKAQGAVEQVWVKDVNTQWETFTKDAEFCKDNKLTPAAEQAYGKVKAVSPEVASFVTFLNKNGGMFHPGFVQLVKMVAKGTGEGDVNRGKDVQEPGGANAFYAKSKAKKK